MGLRPSFLLLVAPGLLAGALCVGTVLATRPAHAADSGEAGDATRSAARKLGVDGVHAYEAGKYDVAMDRLERAFKVLAVPSLGLWSARALEKNGRLVEAAERYLKTTRLPVDSSSDRAVQEQAKKDAASEHEALVSRIPNLIVEVRNTNEGDVEVTVAGAPINAALVGTPFPANPGRVVVVAESDGTRVQAEATLVEGQTATVVLDFTGATPVASDGTPTEPPRAESRSAAATATADSGRTGGGAWRPVVGWTAVGLGAGGLAAGLITGLMAQDKFNALECESNGACPVGSSDDDIRAINDLRTVSTVAFIAGGVLAAGGITLLLIPPKRTTAAHLTPYVGTTTLGIRGTF
jgi:hypothetical protein